MKVLSRGAERGQRRSALPGKGNTYALANVLMLRMRSGRQVNTFTDENVQSNIDVTLSNHDSMIYTSM